MKPFPTIFGLLALLLLAGCGSKGDLFLPEEPPPAAPAEDAEDDESGE